jgi:predicted restriction endonuclease
MSDAICRWRNPYLKNVRLLIDVLPKTHMTSQEGRDFTNKNFKSNFFGTPYQSACQLGLYYEEDGYFFPRFTYKPTNDEIYNYLRNWILLYPAPNPYTKGFKQMEPFSIHSKLCELMIDRQNSIEWEKALFSIFNENIGNKDILKNSINNYSQVIEINEKKILQLKPAICYNDLKNHLRTINFSARNDKKSFFNLFNNNLPEDLFTTSEYDLIEKTLAEILNSDDDDVETIRKAIIKARIGQSKFRKNLLDSERNKCLFTEIENEKLLLAGHILPWWESTNRQRLDINNGILLTPTFDKLFDKFLISFGENGKVIFSKKIEDIDWIKLFPTFEQIKVTEIVINEYNKEYLDYHRRKFNEI